MISYSPHYDYLFCTHYDLPVYLFKMVFCIYACIHDEKSVCLNIYRLYGTGLEDVRIKPKMYANLRITFESMMLLLKLCENCAATYRYVIANIK